MEWAEELTIYIFKVLPELYPREKISASYSAVSEIQIWQNQQKVPKMTVFADFLQNHRMALAKKTAQ